MNDQSRSEQKSHSEQDEADERNPLSSVVLAALGQVQLPVEVRVGSATMSLGELTDCGPGTVLTLDTEVGELADLLIGGQLVARGELVAMDDQLGLRIVEVVSHGGHDEK